MPEHVLRVEMREVHERIVDRLRAAQAPAPKSSEWKQKAELGAEGIETTDLGISSSIVPTTFDDEAAAPVPREAVPAQGCDHLSVLPAGG